jgi:hypothetical protein
MATQSKIQRHKRELRPLTVLPQSREMVLFPARMPINTEMDEYTLVWNTKSLWK